MNALSAVVTYFVARQSTASVAMDPLTTGLDTLALRHLTSWNPEVFGVALLDPSAPPLLPMCTIFVGVLLQAIGVQRKRFGVERMCSSFRSRRVGCRLFAAVSIRHFLLFAIRFRIRLILVVRSLLPSASRGASISCLSGITTPRCCARSTVPS